MKADCERCDRARFSQENRHRVTFHDETDSTINHEVVRLCPDCWRKVRDLARKVIA